jgi:hypothetical protein
MLGIDRARHSETDLTSAKIRNSNNLKVVGNKKIEEHNQESIIRRA